MHGRTKIVVRGQISDYIPTPPSSGWPRPGAQEEYFKHGNPEGKSYREILGRGIDAPRLPEPGGPARAHQRAGHPVRHHVPHLGQPGRGADDDDPDLTQAVIHALNQWMHEHWTFNYENRIFPAPVITLPWWTRPSRARVGVDGAPGPS